MSLAPGMRIGPYEVTSPLGEGGMGVVFRARDTQLRRDVALKLLPDHFADDPERVGRLLREAQALASLNHSNIAQIYGLEKMDGSGCIVMELVEGETIADRLKRGPIPISEAVSIAKQIAVALEEAHDHGIVHRDLKPANIKLTPDGNVKVLDFGLAKTLGMEDPKVLPDSPTGISRSVAGVVMGTPAYMSPEQARGKPVDSRTDIWAFGCILYEMLTAKAAFAGEGTTDIVAKIIEGQPQWDLLPRDTPPHIRSLIEVTLSKQAKQRLQHIGDTRLFWDRALSPEIPNPKAAGQRSHWRATAALAVVCAVLAVALLAAFVRSSRPMPNAAAVRFEMTAPGILSNSLSISPDGRKIAYTAIVNGKSEIWTRPTGSVHAQPLAGTENASNTHFWSPDSQFIAFYASGHLQKININGGTPVRLADTQLSMTGTWSRDHTILFTSTRGSFALISRVPDLGGEITPVTTPDPTSVNQIRPQFLPDGRHFLYLGSRERSLSSFIGALYVGSLDSKIVKKVMDVNLAAGDPDPTFAPPGYLLFGRNGTLMAQQFDLGTLELKGQAEPLEEQVGVLGVSENGTLVYRRPSAAAAPQPVNELVWVDRGGHLLSKSGAPGQYRDLRLSPDEHHIVVDKMDDGNLDIWALGINPPSTTRITLDPALDIGPVLNPAGTQVAFASDRGPNRRIFQRAVDGSGSDQVLYAGETNEFSTPTDWSSDGQYIVFSHSATAQLNVWLLPLFGDRKPFPFLPDTPKFRRGQGRLSPDRRWLAYVTTELGKPEIYVSTFPDPGGGSWQVSTNGGIDPRWKRDGRELYYVSLDGRLMAVSIQGGNALGNGPPVPLFQTHFAGEAAGSSTAYDVTADGRRFLIIAPIDTPSSTSTDSTTAEPIFTIANWLSVLHRN